MKITLSVIVPIYNAEETLERCVMSILQQGLQDMEMILVDDGSTDSSPAMCDTWTEKDVRIRTVHKKNGGLSDARNTGIGMAKGQYVTFVDSDDELRPGIYRRMMDTLAEHQEIDFVEFSFNAIGWGKRDTKYKDCIYRSARHYWRDTHGWNHAYAWNKIFRREMFDTIRFPVGKVYEDIWILPALLKKAKVIATSSFVGYNYYAYNSGICAKPDSEKLKECLAADLNAQREMGTRWYMMKEWDFFRSMLYCQVDIYRLSGEIILKWPLVRLVCWVHKHTKGRGR